MPIKIALPKGRLLTRTAALLRKADLGLDEYHDKVNSYRFKSRNHHNLLVKVFHEKDIPIQVAIGNYDLGICGLDWVEELLAKYPSSALVKVKDLGYGEGVLYMVAGSSETQTVMAQIKDKPDITRIASEYPNLAESFALRNRLRRFSIFPVWGAAEVFPPENADLALISARSEADLDSYGMAAVSKVLDFGAVIIGNKNSWESKDLFDVVTAICDKLPAATKRYSSATAVKTPKAVRQYPVVTESTVRLALPDGHQQLPTLQLLNKAGIRIDDYPSSTGNRRPTINMEGVAVKVMRPQDMPLQVANGNFDLAVTGRDWLTEQRYQFPSMPVEELLDLKSGKVKIVAVVSQELPVTDVNGLRQMIMKNSTTLRVASEYVNIADKYARDNHLGHYRVVPTWGASEGFLPDDADLLIENTETGRTIARHNLRIIDTLFESTACLIGNSDSIASPSKRNRVKSIMERLQAALEDA